MTVKELTKRLEGYPPDEVRILIQMDDGNGYTKQVNCEIVDYGCTEQGGAFSSVVVLQPDLSELDDNF